ncbi:PLP-dependent aminotransferase family protein [Granulosicoccaceae sp. 1_MG-2023]|nr:PLP-dependent aminotransferase family protein [Granulosicoccaceae sp. 1_MG-2023]
MTQSDLPHFSRRISRLTSSLIRELLALTQQPGIISFAGGLPAEALMPPLSLEGVPPALRQYGTTDGEPGLREALSARLNAQGLACPAENVLITSGSQQGIDMVAKVFIDEGTPVLLEKPAYLAALQVYGLYGAAMQGVAVHPDGIDMDSLRAVCAAQRPVFLYINPSFQNPTGYSYSDARRRELAAFLDEQNIVLIEDNPYGELSYDAPQPAPVSAYLKSAPWVYLGSFSKIAVPAWRVGYLAADPRLAPVFRKIKQGTDLHTNRPGQWWCEQFLRDEAGLAAHLDRLRDYYRGQRDAMEAALNEHMADVAEWSAPQGGLFFWVRVHAVEDTRALLDEALARQVAYLPGEAFYPPGSGVCNAIRLSFSGVSRESLNEGVARLGALFREHRR